MSKNPSVNCKSQERSSIPVTEPKKTLFCPRSMVRYDGSPNEYGTKWICKMCLKCILSEEAVKNHLINCSGKANPYLNKSTPIPSSRSKNYEDTGYTCEYCKKKFSRRVTLKKHLEQHVKSSSSEDDSELSDCMIVDDPLVTENANDDNE